MLQVMTKNTYTLQFQKNNSPFFIDKTLHEQEKTFSTIKIEQPIKHQNLYQNRLLL